MSEVKIAVDIPVALQKRFKRYCKQHGLKQKHTITNMISRFLLEAEGNPSTFRAEKQRRKVATC